MTTINATPRTPPRLPAAVLALLVLLAAALPAPRPAAAQSSVGVVEKYGPAVVNISTTRLRRPEQIQGDDVAYFQFYQEPIKMRGGQLGNALGTGFLISADGIILTNEHVVERAKDLRIIVTTGRGETYNARYLAGDPARDLAVLKIAPRKPTPYISLSPGDLSPSRQGQSVIAIGNPYGLANSVTRGIISGINRKVTAGGVVYTNLVQTDAAINPGNSGGPLLDLDGRLVGVNSVKLARDSYDRPLQSINFAISAHKVAETANALLRGNSSPPDSANGGAPVLTGQTRPVSLPTPAQPASTARFGLRLGELPPPRARALGHPDTRGVLIESVEPRSPAAQSRLLPGQILITIGGRSPIATVREAEALLAHVKPHWTITAQVLPPGPAGPRPSSPRNVTITAR